MHVFRFPTFVPDTFPIQYVRLGDNATYTFAVGGGRGGPEGFTLAARSQITRILPQSAVTLVHLGGGTYSITVKPTRAGIAEVGLSVTDNSVVLDTHSSLWRCQLKGCRQYSWTVRGLSSRSLNSSAEDLRFALMSRLMAWMTPWKFGWKR